MLKFGTIFLFNLFEIQEFNLVMIKKTKIQLSK
jgi:hypothetical protein